MVRSIGNWQWGDGNTLACTVATLPLLGHLLPMAAVVRAMRQRGIAVTWVTGEAARPLVERAGATLWPMPSRPWTPQPSLPDVVARCVEDGPAQFQACQGLQPGPILADPTMLGVHSFAQATDRPLVILGISPFFAVPPEAVEVWQTTIQDFEPWPYWYQQSVRFFGPLTLAQEWQEPPWWKELPDGRPRIVITEGTIPRTSRLIPAALEGLRQEPIAAIAFPADPRRYPGAFVSPWLPMAHVLQSAACFVTNGSYGGIQTALACGVPVVVAGDEDDQPENGLRVEYSGLGIHVAPPYTPERIREAVRMILRTPRFTERAKVLQSRCPGKAAERMADAMVSALTQARAA